MLLESLSQPDRNTPFMHTAMIILVSTGKIHLCLQKHDRCRFGHRNYVFQIITSSYTYPSWASEYFQGIRVHTCCCAWKCNSKKKKAGFQILISTTCQCTVTPASEEVYYFTDNSSISTYLVFPLTQWLDFFKFWKVGPFENIKHSTTHTKLFPHVEF